MRRRRVLIPLAAVVVVAAVAVVVVATREPADGGGDRSFVVDGQVYNCGTSGRVRPEVLLVYPGPNPTVLLDGRPVPGGHPGGDRFEWRPLAPLPDYSCADNQTHTLRIDDDLPGNSFWRACGFTINPAVQLRAGYNSPDFPGYEAGERQCEATWTD